MHCHSPPPQTVSIEQKLFSSNFLTDKKMSRKNTTVTILVIVLLLFWLVLVSDNNKGSFATDNKTIVLLCNNTENQKLCYDVLSPIKTSDPKDYISAIMETSLSNVIAALNMSERLTVENKNNSNPRIMMALENCNKFLESSIGELIKASNLLVEESNKFPNMNEHVIADMKNSLGAVIAYHQSCLEGFNFKFNNNTDVAAKQVRFQLEKGCLDNGGNITGMTLDIVSTFDHFNLSNNNNLKGRRLLHDREGYPTWFSHADRKLLSKLNKVKPNAIVAKDGSGQFKTIKDAINSYPENYHGRFVIYVKAGVYAEYVIVDEKKPNILLYGDGPTKTIVTGRKSVAYDNLETMRTATFSTAAYGFIGKSIAFENTVGPKGGQAVALHVQGDHSAFFDCAMHGYQDTLYVHTQRQFYRNCEISGTIDFIFGHSTTLIQNSKIIVRNPGPNKKENTVVADGRSRESMPTGIVLQNCQIMPAPDLDRLTVKTYLARPWRGYSRAVFIENFIGDFIQPQGYVPWNPNEPNTQNSYFAEFGNTGPGANTMARAKWGKGLISKNEAARFTAEQWIKASTWLPSTRIPFDAGFTKP